MLVACIVLALYFWAFFANVESIAHSLLVSKSAAVLAGASLLAAFVFYLWPPQKRLFYASLTVFVLLAVLTAVLIIDTGLTASPFIALWMVVSVFAGIFGAYGIVPLFITLTIFIIQTVLSGSLTTQHIMTIGLGGLAPLVAGYLLWHNQKSSKGDGDKAYRELATELSQVAGKAEVVINAIADGVIALNGRGVIELINPAAQRLIGWGKQDALGLDYKSVLKLLDKKRAPLSQ